MQTRSGASTSSRETGEIGMVPWEGSQVVWPWESGWEQDLYRPEVTSLLKEEKKERKPK